MCVKVWDIPSGAGEQVVDKPRYVLLGGSRRQHQAEGEPSAGQGLCVDDGRITACFGTVVRSYIFS